MARIYCAPWLPGDETAFTPAPLRAEERAAVAWDWSRGPPGPTWTLLRQSGEVVGVAGLHDRGEGVFEAWSSLGEVRPMEWPRLLWLAARRLEGAWLHGAHTVLAACRAGEGGAQRCLEILGFAPLETGEDPRLPGVAIRYMQKAA